MSTQTHTCMVIHCDECKKPLQYDGLTVHFDTVDDARPAADDEGWRFIGAQHVCADCKYKPHAFVPEYVGGVVCERCDLDEDEHEELTAKAVAR